VKYYYSQNISRYEKMRRLGVEAWADETYGGTDYADFSSKPFLDDVVPRLRFAEPDRTALELGCGVGPGAIYLTGSGFKVSGIDLIPEAIEQARKIATDLHLEIQYDVLDVTEIPRIGPHFDLIVDSYCLQSIVLDEDREAVLSAVKSRLAPTGYYLVSTAMYVEHRHRPQEKVVDGDTGRSFDRYDEDCIFEPQSGLHYEPYRRRDGVDDTPTSCEEAILVNGQPYVQLRRYLDGRGLKNEVESYGFEVIYQSGDETENLVAVHRTSGVTLKA
jgi:SAM-dependent methyltransferase